MSTEPWLTDEQQEIWRDWLSVQTRLPAVLNRELQADQQLSLPDFDVLVHLSEAEDNRLRMSALAEELNWEQSRLSHQVSRMEKRGLVYREPCPQDARGSFACLTDQGRGRLEAAAPGHARTVRALLFDHLDADEQATLAGLVRRVLDRVAVAEA
ncbi:MarR family transcriptional regulator [Ammonicoccus fulvus]|uniref:MarR family transcriptional regulator n=1 Tax=Ammonicoccus fulvus TaxID=3138240 RepID=A0ABZ3FNC1_9ACTN